MPRLLRMLPATFLLFWAIIDALFHRGMSSTSACLRILCVRLHVLETMTITTLAEPHSDSIYSSSHWVFSDDFDIARNGEFQSIFIQLCETSTIALK